MTPHELIVLLAGKTGPCFRACAYCPEDLNTAEIKECVEGMLKTIYRLQADKDELLNDLVNINMEYRNVTGHDFKFGENKNDLA